MNKNEQLQKDFDSIEDIDLDWQNECDEAKANMEDSWTLECQNIQEENASLPKMRKQKEGKEKKQNRK